MTPRLRAPCGVTILLTPSAALAHSPIRDIGNFYGGLLHPVLVPAQLLLLLALGLLLGQQAPAENKVPLLAFLICTVAGLVYAGLASGGELATAQLLGTTVFGLLVALHPKIPVTVRTVFSAFAALTVGADSGQAELTGAALFAALAGTGIGMTILLLCTMGMADYLQEKPWQKIGVRILGSWITTSALLVLSLSLRTAPA